MYKLLSKQNDTPTGKTSWNRKYRFDENEWKIIYTEPFKITKDRQFSGFKLELTIKSWRQILSYLKLN